MIPPRKCGAFDTNKADVLIQMNAICKIILYLFHFYFFIHSTFILFSAEKTAHIKMYLYDPGALFCNT